MSVAKQLQEAHVDYAIAGGYAVALHGAVRGTMDLDLVLRLERENFLAAVAALRRLRLEPRLPATAEEVFQFRKEYLANRGLVEWDFRNPEEPAERVDILLGYDLENLEINWLALNKIKLPVVSSADLIRMKRRSERPQDLEDARALEMIGG